MKKIFRTLLSLSLFIFYFNNAEAQKIKFLVLNIKTGAPLGNVKISSRPEQLFLTYANNKGEFALNILKDDTIELSKENFHVLLLKIKASNFDTSHAIVVGMVPQSFGKSSGKYSSLQDFEYHFIHDTLGDQSHLKVNVLENVKAVKQRTRYQDRAFHIAAVKIDKVPPVDDPKETRKSSYKLNK